MKTTFRRLRSARAAAVTVILFAAIACLGVAGAPRAFASTTGLTPSFCLQSGNYCLSDSNGADQAVNMQQSGAPDEDFIAQLTGRCGGHVTSDCPFADTALDTRYEGFPIVQLYDQAVDRCVGTDSRGSAVFAACNSVSTGTGGGDGTLFINHGGYMINVYWTDSGQYGDEPACMGPVSADSTSSGDGVSLDQDSSAGCPLWTFGHSAVTDYAVSIVNGVPEYYAGMADQGSGAWTGGTLWYGWDGGHGQYPGPSAADCTGDPDCVTATNEHKAGNSSVHGYEGEITLDCSGFSRWVYSLAYGQDVLGGGDTINQDNELVSVSGDPTSGDLVFFDNEDPTPDPNNSTHVGVYIGNNQMIDEPCTQIVGRKDCHAKVDVIVVATFGGIVGYYEQQ